MDRTRDCVRANAPEEAVEVAALLRRSFLQPAQGRVQRTKHAYCRAHVMPNVLILPRKSEREIRSNDNCKPAVASPILLAAHVTRQVLTRLCGPLAAGRAPQVPDNVHSLHKARVVKLFVDRGLVVFRVDRAFDSSND